jgi:hypothetical protein
LYELFPKITYKTAIFSLSVPRGRPLSLA